MDPGSFVFKDNIDNVGIAYYRERKKLSRFLSIKA